MRIEIVTDRGPEAHEEVFTQRLETRTYPLKGSFRYVSFDADHRLLARVDFPRSVEELVRQLAQAPDAAGRREAVEALADASPLEARPALRQALRFDLFHGVRSAAAAVLSRQGATSDLVEALRRETDSRVLQNIVTALEPFAGRLDVQAALRDAASQPSPYVRAAALLALARAKASGVFPLLQRALEENAHRDVVRAAAFHGLAALGDTRAVPLITRYLRSDRTTRWGREPAVEALGALAGGDPEARRLLEDIRLHDFWPGIRESAARFLH